MRESVFLLGLDDTDAPDGMCTTWLGAKLIRVFTDLGMNVIEAKLIRLNPTIKYKTRGNAAIALKIKGDPSLAFKITCDYVSRYARLSCDKTNPGVVVTEKIPPVSFYRKAVTGYCSIEEAELILRHYALFWKGYKLKRGLVGATAAVSSHFSDYTWECLTYRSPDLKSTLREVEPVSLLLSEELTTPHTWDTWDHELNKPVCIPHTPDPVIFGIRGDSPFYIMRAVSAIDSERYDLAQLWLTNQGTDAHILEGKYSDLTEGRSYLVRGRVSDTPVTQEGGHVSFHLSLDGGMLFCMAFEPTKGFRDIIRMLCSGDEILAMGSYQKNTINLEKICVIHQNISQLVKPPICHKCGKRMTSAGTGKGYKCRICGGRSMESELVTKERLPLSGWYEVPPGSRRHLSRPLIRGPLPSDGSYLPINEG